MTLSTQRTVGTLVAAVTAAALVWLGTGLHPVWPALWLAPLPLLYLAPGRTARVAGASALASWFVGTLNLWKYYSAVLEFGVAATLGVLAANALIFALAVLLFRALLQRGAPWMSALSLPATWVSYEFVLSTASPHGTAGNIAYTQSDFLPFIQLASITGPWGVSFLLLAFSSALAVVLRSRHACPRRALRIALAVAGTIGMALAFGLVRLALPQSGSSLRVALLASDAPNAVAVANGGLESRALLEAYSQQAEAAALSSADAVVLPEKVAVTEDAATSDVDTLFQPLADRYRMRIVTGLVHLRPEGGSNEARVFRPGSMPTAYSKHHLIPMFESRLQSGTSLLFLPGPTSPLGVAICKDMDFTAPARDYGRAGAGLLLVPAWDFVVDRWLHSRMAVMRGVESGFAVVRSARQGLLTVSDNRGRVLAETPSDALPFAKLLVDAPDAHSSTVYAALGDWFAWATLATFVALLLCLRRRPLSTENSGLAIPALGVPSCDDVALHRPVPAPNRPSHPDD